MPSAPPAPHVQPRNPLHGVTLEAMLTSLVAAYGWPGLGERIALRCFTKEPSIASSLKVLRKTPWAREKVESLYLYLLRERKRSGQSGP
jgi:uncharacterized protein (DUF2132 family)